MRLVATLMFMAAAACGLAGNAQAKVDVRIDLASQTMRVTSLEGSYVFPISSARSGFVTPRGSYRPQRLERMHYSRKYHMSPMPHSIFFRGGYAIHGTNSVRELGRPASHGCIRLAPGHAAKLYAMVQAEGARISITGTPPRSTAFAKLQKRSVKTKVAVAKVKRLAAPLAYVPVRYQPRTPSFRFWLTHPAPGFR